MSFTIFENEDMALWRKELESFPADVKDVFYSPSYYKTWAGIEKGRACFAYYEDNGMKFLYPFFLAEIEGYDLPGRYFDIMTAYGYGGVIANHPNPPEKSISSFNEAFSQWALENKVVTEFIRQDPLSEHYFRKTEYIPVRKNVIVENYPGYEPHSRQARKNLRRAEKSNLEVIIDKDFEFLSEFIRLYNMSAKRLGMEDFYFFPEIFYQHVAEMLSGFSGLLHVRKENVFISSLLFFEYGERVTCHLIGSDPDYNDTRMNDLVYKSIIDYATSKGYKITHLGGGLTNNEEDSLFRFKEKFGTASRDVVIGKNILLPEIYKSLEGQWRKKYPEAVDKYENYVLKYRYTR